MKRLIIVPGHASFKQEVSLPLSVDVNNDEFWALQDFQKGEPPYYIEHIAKGLELITESSLLIFSGGRTRVESGQYWGEAKTYNEIAKRLPGYNSDVVALEDFARDSFQNLAYSIRKFTAITGHTPQHITIVGWAFKEERYALHAATLDIPKDRFHYVPVNNPDSLQLQGALIGEEKPSINSLPVHSVIMAFFWKNVLRETLGTTVSRKTINP